MNSSSYPHLPGDPTRLPGLRFSRMAHLSSFTLIELMAASTVLSIVLLLMVGMQDQMSKAWTNANRRTDSTREARATFQVLSSDFAFPIFRDLTNQSTKDQLAPSVTNRGLPFVCSLDGKGDIGIAMPSLLPNSSCFFMAASQRPPPGQTDDLALVGYYVARDTFTNLNGFRIVSYNLHRYCRTTNEAATNLVNWFTSLTASSPSAGTLFPAVDLDRDDILARNVANFRILIYNNLSKPVTNGINYANISGGTNGYQGNKLQISIDLYPDDVAQKFQTVETWTDPANIRKYSRNYEFRIDSNRN
ncbi:MAG: hypothetical protein EB090_04825 [Verrucomicrobia bacterium]|nr:hypothetical protein [Verrucomicrobiota bacterium]